MSVTSPTAPTSSRQQPAHGLHLACRECQRKKVKCDRNFPCIQCSRAALPCVPSTRKPRAKTGAKAVDAELRQRIAKLEKLVENFQGDEDGDAQGEQNLEPADRRSASQTQPFATRQPDLSPAKQDSNSPSSPSDTASAQANKYVASTFWSSLTTEVKALADAFEEDAGEGDDDDTSPDSAFSAPYALDPSEPAKKYELIFCPPGVLYVMPGAMKEPDRDLAMKLFKLFLEHVESMHRVSHVPSLRRFMEQGLPYLGRAADAPCNRALRAAVYFAGVTACSEEESLELCGKPLDDLVKEYRRMVDIALYEADPLNTTELATLQALAIYVGSIRVIDSSRRAWSMVGLLVRIARAMSIHRELPDETPFISELRRRLWFNLVFLDCYSSIDRGSEAAIHPHSFTRLLPSHVNDADFDENSTVIISRQGEITDMSLALVTQEGSILALRMALAEMEYASQPWQRRLELAYEYQRVVQEKYLRFCDPDNSFHRKILAAGTAACHSMILRAVRPVQHLPNSSAPPVDSPYVMELALNILRHSEGLWESIHGRWRRAPWVPWHAMAVTLAGLCSVRDTLQANEAWRLVEKAMAQYSHRIADSKNGMLWKPLEKLYKKAKTFRDVRQDTKPTLSSQPSATQDTLYNENITLDQIPITTPDSATIDIMLNDMNNIPIPGVFDFPPEMHAALPNDNSWLDWEAIMKDMDGIQADEMQWT